MAISQLIVGVYNTDGENCQTTYAAPFVSGVAFTAVGNVTNGAWAPGTFQADSFSDANAVSTGSTEQLYTTGNTTDISALGSSYSSGAEDTFTWGGPGGGAYADQGVSVNSGVLSVSLDSSVWGLIRNAELIVTSADAAGLPSVNMQGFQVSNIQYDGAGTVNLYSVQNGTEDFHLATGAVNLNLQTAAYTGAGAGSTIVVETSAYGGTISANHYSVGASYDYAGDALTLNGSTSLLDVNVTAAAAGTTSGAVVYLTDSQISSNIYVTSGNTATMTFSSSGGITNLLTSSQSTAIDLGTGAANIYTDENDVSVIKGWVHGTDKGDMTLPSAAGFSDTSCTTLGLTGLAFTDTGMHHGVFITSASGSQPTVSTSVVSESGVYHLIIT